MQKDTLIESGKRTGRPDFDNIVERYYRTLYQFALSLSGSEADAWDLTQQTFYTWSLKGDQLRDTSKVKAWLFTTLHRSFLQTRRKDVRFPHYELSQVDFELPTIPPHHESRLDYQKVREALENVSETFRAPLALFYLEDYAYKEIAVILDMPLGTVKSRIARGIAQMHKILEPPECSLEPMAA
jgi:RNA polymerase sigma-70 factor (ECF subfamily)